MLFNKKIILSDLINKINYYTFLNCESLNEINIPKSIKSINDVDKNTLNCNKLKNNDNFIFPDRLKEYKNKFDNDSFEDSDNDNDNDFI